MVGNYSGSPPNTVIPKSLSPAAIQSQQISEKAEQVQVLIVLLFVSFKGLLVMLELEPLLLFAAVESEEHKKKKMARGSKAVCCAW